MTPVQVDIWGASRSIGRKLGQLLREEGDVAVSLHAGSLPPALDTLPHLLILFGYPESLREQVEAVRATSDGEQVVLVVALSDRTTPETLSGLLYAGIDDVLDVGAPPTLLKAR
ncbi:MAG: histidine kinase, partial [Clostridia bacterium]